MYNLIQEFSEDIPKKTIGIYVLIKLILRNYDKRIKTNKLMVVNINSNILQIDWKKEKLLLPAIRSYKDSLNIIESGIKESIRGYINNIPEEWNNFDS